MTWYRNLRIRGKLFVGFGALMVLLALMVITAAVSEQRLFAQAHELGTERYPKADAANDLIKFSLTAANSYRDVAFSDNSAEIREDLNIIRKSREGFDLTLVKLELMVDAEDERAMLAVIKSHLARLNADFDTYFQLLETDKGKLGNFIANRIAVTNDSLIVALQAMEDYQAAKVVAIAGETDAQYASARTYTWTVGLLSLLLALFLSYFISRDIATAITRASELVSSFVTGWQEKAAIASAIAAGDLEHDVSIARPLDIDTRTLASDEGGQLLRTVHTLSQVQVGFDTALSDMSRSLREQRTSERMSDWQKTGTARLAEVLRTEQTLAETMDRALAFLAEWLRAGSGALYLLDAGATALRLTATYAFTRRKQIGDSCAIGEGLVGQVARERKPICWTEVPADYVQIASALGQATPRNAVALPILRDDRLYGVIELATFHDLADHELDFLNKSREAIAIAIAVAESRRRVDALLSETQQQAEKLQVQQEQLQQSNEELEERARLLESQKRQVDAKNREIEQVSHEIQRQADEIKRVSTYKSEFLANMSHELRTPLNSIMILSRLLADSQEGALTDKQREFATTIGKAGQDLLNLINDILDLSRVEAGQMPFSIEPVAPAALAQSLDALFRPLAEEKALDFEIHLADDLPASFATDEQRLQQIVKNLLANAIKFTRHGSVTLSIATADAVEGGIVSPALTFAVADTGIGIAADQQASIFEAFQQGDGSISRQYGGTGLGLSIARQLARRLGGDIRLESTVGRGSVFTLWLPLTAPAGIAGNAPPAVDAAPATGGQQRRQRLPAAAHGAPATAAARPTSAIADDRADLKEGGRSILVVEDDPAFARILSDMVREKGFSVLVATDGESGFLLAETYRPQAILLDVMLPGIDGWAVMRRLKDHPLTRHIPVHFITCLDERQRALSMGAVGLITKPVSPQQIDAVLARLEQVIDRGAGRLLIVEDDADEREALVELLSERDIAISTAVSGAEAIRVLDSTAVDCVVLDLGLSDMSGFAVLDHLLARDPGRHLPVIIHTGRELTHDEQYRLERYASSIIIKGAQSPERLLNEVTLFLHLVDSRLPPEKRRMIRLALDKEAMLEGRKVLVADDDMRNVFSLASLLSEKGMTVIEAENGREALARLAEQPDIDIVLMDIMMPEMDGYAAMQAIRADPRYRRLPLIAMTAKAMRGDQEKCIAAGADDYIAKPLDADKLFSLLRVWLYEGRPEH